ncbi:MAG: hypothetical protein IH948_10795 [Bacteroidetes bacterium]|nr:hypothetical protein [Bacteroidota bacterium]
MYREIRPIGNKKGQAAMEFLMTYGWAILAAIIVIGVLAIYFRPSSLTQTQVIVTAPFYGVGTTISENIVQVEVRNNGGESLQTLATGTSLSFTQPSDATCTTNWVNGTITAGGSQIVIFDACSGLAPGDTVNAAVVLSYRRPGSSLDLTSTGTLSGNVP